MGKVILELLESSFPDALLRTSKKLTAFWTRVLLERPAVHFYTFLIRSRVEG